MTKDEGTQTSHVMKKPSGCSNHARQWPLLTEIGQNTKPEEVPCPFQMGIDSQHDK